MADQGSSEALATVTATLNERGRQYGPFDDIADVAQNIKANLRSGSGWKVLSSSEAEACDLIATKLARVVNGGFSEDHWNDIAGYAMLALEGHGK